MTRIIAKGAPRCRTEPEPVERDAPMPVLRLRRMGVSAALIDSVAAMWATWDDETAAAAAASMEEMSDRDVLAALVGAPDVGADAAAWAEAHPYPQDAHLLLGMEG